MSDNKKIRAADHDSYTVYSIIGLLVPIVGFIIGAIMLTKDNKLDKKVGEHTIVCSILGIVLAIILWIVWLTASATSELPLTNGY